MNEKKPVKKKTNPYLSIILPVYNEKENVKIQYESIIGSLSSVKYSFEIIFIDDGSLDNSFLIMKDIAQKDKKVKIVKFSKNFGQTAALAAGIHYSRGEVIVIMDSDLQNDAHDIIRFVEKIEEGYDVVNGWRKERKDKFISRKFVSMIANWIISRASGIKLKDLGSSQAYKGDILRQVKLYGEMHRFIPIHASWLGARITEIPVKHHPRKYGKSNYGIVRTFKVILDLVTVKFLGSYSTKPIYIFGGMGILLFFFSIISGAVVILMKILNGMNMTGNPFLLLTIMLIILSVMFILLGILAEILIRIYHETSDETPYKVREKINID